MKGFADIKDLAEINGGSTLITSTTISNKIVTLKYGILTPPILAYGVRPLYGIYPVTIKE
ncbi:hypothetical protein [Clostridium cellulovorans]|uniref:Uncharacterized protein n=1 Tax=Clostridium cellulovorans (strain ATCC 35296 / DSM 3052 / OCM 3 / 743B) TaxID=573061 RepID=D9SMC6_CLOC7|nr:hypothetical protein [Clostridium cellulovorans]ADL53782.1 hypothetical protein Clocel_4121 [Clostridium cellulovorans 743B]